MKVNFLIAEEVRPEANGKMSVIGLFAGDTIVVLKGKLPDGLPEDTPAGIDRLTILVIVVDAYGPHSFKGRLIEPSGNLYQPEMVLGDADILKGNSHTLIVHLRPFIVRQPGVFVFEFFVDDVKFTFPFEVREQLVS
jgi:hypothetical protein